MADAAVLLLVVPGGQRQRSHFVQNRSASTAAKFSLALRSLIEVQEPLPEASVAPPVIRVEENAAIGTSHELTASGGSESVGIIAVPDK